MVAEKQELLAVLDLWPSMLQPVRERTIMLCIAEFTQRTITPVLCVVSEHLEERKG